MVQGVVALPEPKPGLQTQVTWVLLAPDVSCWPAGQTDVLQSVMLWEFGVLTVPAGQDRHGSVLPPVPKVLAGQDAQLEPPNPGLQTQALSEVAAVVGFVVNPAPELPQRVQGALGAVEVPPVEKVPAGHAAQVGPPKPAWHTHALEEVEPAGLVEFAGHAVQASRLKPVL